MENPGIEDGERRTPLLSMRAKAMALGAVFLGGMVLIAAPGMPYLTAAIQDILYGGEYSSQPAVIGCGWLLGAQMSPTGRVLATMSESAIHIWFTNGTLLSTFHALGGIPWAGFDWSPGGDMIAAVDYLGNVTVVTMPGLYVVTRWRKKPIYDLSIMWTDILRMNTWPVKWSPNGSLVAFGYCDARTHLLNVSSQKHTELGSNPNRPNFEWTEVRTIDWDPSGSLLIKAARKSFVVYDMHTLEALYEIGKEEHSWGNESVAFSPDGGRVAALKKRTRGSPEATYHLDMHDSTQGELTHTVNISAEPMDMAWSPDGRLIAVGDKAGNLICYRSDQLQVEQNISAHTGPISSLSWRSGYLVSASDDQTVKLWALNQVGELVLVRSITGWGSGFSWIQFASHNEILAGSIAPGDSIRVHRPDGSSSVLLPNDPRIGDFNSAALSPDGKRIGTITTRGMFSSWDAHYGTLETRWTVNPEDGVIAWNPADPTIVATGGPSGVKIWDLEGEKESPAADLRIGEIRCIAWSPDGALLAIGVPSRIEIWDPASQRLLCSVNTWKLLYSLEWSPDSSMLASLAGSDPWWGYIPNGNDPCTAFPAAAILEIWDTATALSGGNLTLVDSRAAVRHYESSPNCIAWAPNSTMVALAAGMPGRFAGQYLGPECGFMDPGVMLYKVDRSTGLDSIQNMTGPLRFVSSVDWSKDGSRIAAGSMDGTIWIWRVGPEGLPQAIGNPGIYLGGALAAVILIDLLRRRTESS